MSITATELKQNLGKYLLLSATEDIFEPKLWVNLDYLFRSSYMSV